MSLISKLNAIALNTGVSRFSKDERGVTAVTFGIVATMLVGGIGATVEISRSISAKNALQLAVDAAVLQAKRREMDLAPKVGVTAARAQGKLAGEKIFWANMDETKSYFKDKSLKVEITFNENTAEAKAVGTGEVDQIFTGAFGAGQMKLAAQAEATWSNTTPVELTMALDMTPSMFQKDDRPTTRFKLLRDASKNFTDTLFNSVSDPSKELLRIAVVPWATTVNVRVEPPRTPSAAAYTSPGIITEAGSQIPMTNQMDRSADVTIADDFAPVGWRGCVAGANESTTSYTDAKPLTKWKALFIPSEQLNTLKDVKIQSACVKKDYVRDDQPMSTAENFYTKSAIQITTLNSASGSTCYDASKIKNQPACVSDPNELEYNQANGTAGWCPWRSKVNWTSYTGIGGPNINCPVPMLGLSSNRSQVMELLDRMAPVSGFTHADVGLRWALRTLSPKTEWKNFFGVTTPISEYNSTTTKKYLLLITDGENTQNTTFPGFWGCSGSNAGCTGAPSQTELNTRMTKWCDAIKNDYGIKIITIALNVDNSNAVNLLKNCASKDEKGQPMAHMIDAADVDKVLQEIAVGVANNLRLKS